VSGVRNCKNKALVLFFRITFDALSRIIDTDIRDTGQIAGKLY
jgi:hypothetical protein